MVARSTTRTTPRPPSPPRGAHGGPVRVPGDNLIPPCPQRDSVIRPAGGRSPPPRATTDVRGRGRRRETLSLARACRATLSRPPTRRNRTSTILGGRPFRRGRPRISRSLRRWACRRDRADRVSWASYMLRSASASASPARENENGVARAGASRFGALSRPSAALRRLPTEGWVSADPYRASRAARARRGVHSRTIVVSTRRPSRQALRLLTPWSRGAS